MSKQKGQTEKIRPYAGDMELAQRIADKVKLTKIDVLSLAMSAGLRAIAHHGLRMPMPLTFQVVEPPPEPIPPVERSAPLLTMETKPFTGKKRGRKPKKGGNAK